MLPFAARAVFVATFVAWPLLGGVAAPAAADRLLVLGQQSQAVHAYDGVSGSFDGVLAATVSDGFRSIGGIALRPTDGVLHVSSPSSGEIWRYDTPTGTVITPALATGLQGPRGLAFDAGGATLFFTDPLDPLSVTTDSVKAMTLPAGPLTTVGTLAGAELSSLVASGGFVFASDEEGNRVVRFPAGGGQATTVISTGLSGPTALLLRTAQRLLIADAGSNRVLEYVESGGSWSFDRVVLPASAGVVQPCALALAPDGRLGVAGCGSDDVVQVDLTTLAVSPGVAPGTAGLSVAKALAWSGEILLVASAATKAVIYYDASGTPTGVRAAGVSTILDGGMVLSPDGARMFVSSFSIGDVVEHDASSGALLRSTPGVCGFLPRGLAWGPDDLLYVACLGDNGVGRLDPATGQALGAFVLGGSGGLFLPRDLAFGPDGHLYVSSGGGEILRYHGSSGAFLGVFVDAGGNGGGALDPYGLVFRDGLLYVASSFPNEVQRFDAASGAFVDTFVPSGAGGLASPTDLAFGGDGDLYVSSSDTDAVLRFDGGNGAFVGTFVASGSGGLDAPLALAFAPGAAPPSVPALPAAATALLSGALPLAGVRVLRARARRTRA